MATYPYYAEVYDCYQNIRRHFADLGIELKDYAFPSDFWDYDDDMFTRLFAKEGFVNVDPDTWKPEPHDLLMIPGSVRVSFPTHLGVITEDGRISHHYTGRFSEISDFKGPWRTPTRIVRHKDVEKLEEEAPKVIDITELMPDHVRRKFVK